MGTTAGADAFAVSMFYVDGISVVAAVGLASYTLVPMFAAQFVEGRSDEAFRLLETASLWLLAFALPIAIACTLAPVPLARFVAPRFTPGQTQLLAGLVPASAWSASLLLLGAVAAGSLQARSQDGWPVAGRALLALSVAGGIWTAAKTNPIRGAALGLLIGAVAQLLLQWWRLWASGWRPRRPRWANPELPATVQLALPAVGATLLTNVVMSGGQSLIASGLPEGSLRRSATRSGRRTSWPTSRWRSRPSR